MQEQHRKTHNEQSSIFLASRGLQTHTLAIHTLKKRKNHALIRTPTLNNELDIVLTVKGSNSLLKTSFHNQNKGQQMGLCKRLCAAATGFLDNFGWDGFPWPFLTPAKKPPAIASFKAAFTIFFKPFLKPGPHEGGISL